MSGTTAQQNQYDYEYAPGWVPKKNEVLEGTIVSIDTGNSAYGPYPIITVEQANGSKKALHAFHQAIRGQLAARRPKVGDPIGIKYLGKKKSANNFTYDVYRVMGGGSEGFDWDAEDKRNGVTPDDANPATDEDVPF